MTVEDWLIGVAFALGFAAGLLYFFQPDKFNEVAAWVMASVQ